MAWNVDFRHDRDTERGGMRNDPPYIILRVMAGACFRPVAELWHEDLVRPAPRADLRQRWIGLDLQPPGFVVGQVPMKDIELVPGEDIDQPQDVGDRIELPGHIEMAAAPVITRLVGDRAEVGEFKSFAIGAGAMQQLRQADEAVAPPRVIRARKHDLMRGETQLVGEGSDRRFGDETNAPPAFDGTQRKRRVFG